MQKINLQSEDLYKLETFLQYGDLKNARYIFIGMEEGLGRHGKIDIAINARLELLKNAKFKNSLNFINGCDYSNGWYISDNSLLKDAEDIIMNISQKIKSPTMGFHKRFLWLMEGNNRNRYGDYTSGKEIVGHKTGSGSAMMDFFPLPKKKTGDFPYDYEKFKDLKTYHKHYSDKSNSRFKILKNLYDNFPMEISIVYAGIENGNFRLKKVYEDLGFNFGVVQHTNKVNKGFPVPEEYSVPKNFILGTRKTSTGNDQKTIMTPFWGNGQISNIDLYVISTWL